MNIYLAYSRPQKTAERLGELAKDRNRFLEKEVLLTGEQGILNTENGCSALLCSLRLLVKICPNVTLLLPEGQDLLRSEAERISKHIAFGKAVEFVSSIQKPDRFAAFLSVGSTIRPDLPWTTINSNGWVARVSSGELPLSAECEMRNPVGALAAACLGVGEVFKRLIALNPARGSLLNGFTFSLRSYAAFPGDCGPELPERINTDLLLVGAGAIGNGIVALLSQLPISGILHMVDRERFAPENLGTCILIGPEDVDKPKATVMENILRTAGKNAYGFESTFENHAASLAGRYPSLVLNGLDYIDVRHEVQRALWPNLIIDGAIGDFACQVSCHPWAGDVACLICLFRQPPRSSEVSAAQATGLRSSRIGVADAVVTSEDVATAPPERGDYLRARLGKPICSVVSEAVAQQISLEQQTRGFEPSVPFVAAFSACMVVAELVRHTSGWPSVLEPRFQFDFLQGPGSGEQYPQSRRLDCLCGRRTNIDRFRAAHGQHA